MRYLSSVSLLCFGLVAGAAHAQDAGCPNGSWIGGDPNSSDISAASNYFEAVSIAPAGQAIESYFSVSNATDVRLEAKGAMGADPVIELLAADGLSIASDDDSGGGTDSRIETTLEPGNYCLRTTSYAEGVLSATVRVGAQTHEALTDGLTSQESGTCDVTTAQQVDVQPDANGAFTPIELTVTVDDNPYVALNVAADAAVSLLTDGEAADSTLTVFDAEMNEIEYNDDFQGLSAAVEFRDGMAAGQYCLTLGALNDSSAPIDLRVERFDPEAARQRDFSAGKVVPPRDGSEYPVTDLGLVEGRAATTANLADDALWFAFDVADATLVRIDVAGPDGSDPILEVFDEFGERIAYNDDVSPENYSSRAYEELFPGTYFFVVTNNTDSAADLRVSVRQYVPLNK